MTSTSSAQGLVTHDSVISDEVFRPSGQSGRQRYDSKTSRDDVFLPEVLKNNLVAALSGLYGMLLVVLGLVLPLAETFARSSRPYVFEVFYLYLYAVSMAFMVYVYAYLLRKERIQFMSLPLSLTRTFSRTFNRSSKKSSSRHSSGDKSGRSPSFRGAFGRPLERQNSVISSGSGRGRRRKIGYNPETSHHTGSFYLRIGVIGFGIGSMIHSGLTFGHYFEINHLGDPCSDIVQAIKPIGHLCFTFVQMYFVFMNSKMCVHKYKTLARFGLMHMSGTNICVWLRSIVVETLHVIKEQERQRYETLVQDYLQQKSAAAASNSTTHTLEGPKEYEEEQIGSLPEINCHWDAMMGKIVSKSSVYLYPCTIEYSLVCACVLYVMWSNVGEGQTKTKDRGLESASDDGLDTSSDSDDRTHRMSVDCAGSSRGLFLGIMLFVVSVVSLICFYVLISTKKHIVEGRMLAHITESFIYVVALMATGIAFYQMRNMHFCVRREAGIEEILTLISLSGLGLFGMFSIVASMFFLGTLEGTLTVLTNTCMIIQAGAQATFTLAAGRVSAVDSAQVREKPGRQFVTFLLIANFALWAINTFETQRLEHNLVQVKLYGNTAWSIFSHISVPLGIYFRFHSTVSLSNVWKKAWKMKHLQGRTQT